MLDSFISKFPQCLLSSFSEISLIFECVLFWSQVFGFFVRVCIPVPSSSVAQLHGMFETQKWLCSHTPARSEACVADEDVLRLS